MRAYETNEGLIEIYNNEPDEIITREEFDRRNEEAKLDAEIAKTEKYLAELKAKKAGNVPVPETAHEVEEDAVPTAENDRVPEGAPTAVKRRW